MLIQVVTVFVFCFSLPAVLSQSQQDDFVQSLRRQGFTDDQIRGFLASQAQRGQQPQQQQQQPQQQQEQQEHERSKVQFTISADNEPYGTITMELFDEAVPITVANFLGLASGQNRNGYTYTNSIFHRIIPNFMLQGGDFERFDGTGGSSIYGPKFDDENFLVKHASPGLLSMANSGPNTNGAQFFITTVKTPWLDDKHVVFGRVDDQNSFDVVKRIEDLGSESGKPAREVKITDSRIIQLGRAGRQG